VVGATVKLYYGYKFQMQQHADSAGWNKAAAVTSPEVEQ